MTLTLEEIYTATEAIHNGDEFDVRPDALLSSIDKSFRKIDPIHSQNFINFLVDEYEYFREEKGSFDIIKEMATYLIGSDQLSSRIAGFTALTKLWLESGDNEGIEQYCKYLFETAKNGEQVPHVRTLCSECLREIWSENPKVFPFSASEILEAANSNLGPTVFPELAASMQDSGEVDEFLKARWWSMAPFERVVFTNESDTIGIPNDPLLLHEALAKGKVSNEMAVSMLDSPLSGFGVAQVIYTFQNAFDFSDCDLFSPYDTQEQVAMKSNLLVGNLESVEKNPVLSGFMNEAANSPIVRAVFNMAGRFEQPDLLVFFRNYYKQTENMDNFWIKLYQKENEVIQRTLRSYMRRFPHRASAQFAVLSSGERKPPLTMVRSVKDQSLLKRLASDKQSEGYALVADRIPPTQTEKSPEIPEVQYINNCFNIVDVIVSTVDKKTTISMAIESLRDGPVYGAEFTIWNNEFFEGEGKAIVPILTTARQIHFEMIPKKIGKCRLSMRCVFTTAGGETIATTLTGNDLLNLDPISFLSASNEPFANVWPQGEESRLQIRLDYQSFAARLSATVFASCDLQNEAIQSTAVTPEGQFIALRALGNEKRTILQFKAQSLDLLTYVDNFFRKFE